MESLRWRALRIALVLCVVAPLRGGAASVSSELDGIQKKIESEKRDISEVLKKEGSVLQLLGKIQDDLEKKTKDLKIAQRKLDLIVNEMGKKEGEAERISASVKRREEVLIKRAVALYRWHRGSSPFVILNGDISLGSFLQRKRYLETTISFDRDLIRQLSQAAQRQDKVNQELEQKKKELESQRRALGEAKDAVRQEAEKKRTMLTSLRKEKAARTRALKELEQAALRLQRTMDEISRRAGSEPRHTPSGMGLDALRGRLEWPVRGQVKSSFGKTKHREFAAEVFRKGIDIEAPLGEQIRAVEKGKVVFAERLTGYGKMVIVDHGDRYYTIYGHLSEILKKNGEEVKRGESVGLAGDSDSLAGVRLYFEMRKDGRSIDPLPWFRK